MVDWRSIAAFGGGEGECDMMRERYNEIATRQMARMAPYRSIHRLWIVSKAAQHITKSALSGDASREHLQGSCVFR